MKIGIVVTVYNTEKYIERCLSSIIGQTYRDLEIVVIDDGSTDNSGAICDRFAEKDGRINVIHQKNKGPIAARLTGVRNITAKSISFVDGDDWLDENMYSDISRRNLIGKYDVVSFGAIVYHSKNDWKKQQDIFDEGVYHRDRIISFMMPNIFWDVEKGTHGVSPSLCGKMFRKAILEKYLLQISNHKFHYGEDAAVLYPLLCEAESIAIVGCCYYYYRQRKNNEVASYFADGDFYKKLYCLYEYLKGQFEKTPYKEALIKQLDYFYMYSVGFGKLKYNDMAFEGMYVFPFKKVERNKKLILYGAGRVGHTFYRQLKRTDYCQIAGWVDRNHSIYRNDMIQPVEVIKSMEYDFIVIAIESAVTAENVKSSLKDMGIDGSKIITM